jgi:hypothetical protein
MCRFDGCGAVPTAKSRARLKPQRPPLDERLVPPHALRIMSDSNADGGYVVPFDKYFPDMAQAECRVATVFNRGDLPDDEYGLLESYCDDPACDCRRVMLNVASRKQKKILATVSFGFDPNDSMCGPFLDPLNRQSKHAPALLKLVETVLQDGQYVARLERHYHLVKNAAKKSRHGKA